MTTNEYEEALRQEFSGVRVTLGTNPRTVLAAARAARRRRIVWLSLAGVLVVALAVAAAVFLSGRVNSRPGPDHGLPLGPSDRYTPPPELAHIMDLSVDDVASIRVAVQPAAHPEIEATDPAEVGVIVDYLAGLRPGPAYEPTATINTYTNVTAYSLILAYTDGDADVVVLVDEAVRLNGGPANGGASYEISHDEFTAFGRAIGAIYLERFRAEYEGRILSCTVTELDQTDGNEPVAWCAGLGTDGRDQTSAIYSEQYVIDTTGGGWLVLHVGDTVEFGINPDGLVDRTFILEHGDLTEPSPAVTTNDPPAPQDPAEARITPPRGYVVDGEAFILANAGIFTDLTGVLVVDLFVDYQCPTCARMLNTDGPALKELMTNGQIALQYHLLTFLDSLMENTSSHMAALAATCADTVDAFQAYSDAVFANQAAAGDEDFPERLRQDIAAQAGIAGDDLVSFQGCYDNALTVDFVLQMQPENTSHIAVPAVALDGVPINDWTQIPTEPDAMLAYFRQLSGTSIP